MRALPAEEKAKIEQLTEGLKLEKRKLERELTKWDQSGNDIIILAKKMCMMMMEMSDFTRWVFIYRTESNVGKTGEHSLHRKLPIVIVGHRREENF